MKLRTEIYVMTDDGSKKALVGAIEHYADSINLIWAALEAGKAAHTIPAGVVVDVAEREGIE